MTDDTLIDKLYGMLEERFYDPEYGLYADCLYADGRMDEYRGHGTQLHIVDAVIVAYEATKNKKYLDRALRMAKRITKDQAAKAGGLIWDHCTKDFELDFDYNKDDPQNLYKPWGHLPGHHAEWGTLLVRLHRHLPNEPWLLERAAEMFDASIEACWDKEHGGLAYAFTPTDKKWCNDDKYFWVQAML